MAPPRKTQAAQSTEAPQQQQQQQQGCLVDEDLYRVIQDLKKELSDKIGAHTARFDQLEHLLKQQQQENRELQAALEEKDREVYSIRRRANDQEQYMRSWSIRILDLPVLGDSHDNDNVMRTVFDKLLRPILQAAVDKQLLVQLPHYTTILETAHILPGKPNSTPPIIARFYSRNIKAMVFRLKREYAPRLSRIGRAHV